MPSQQLHSWILKESASDHRSETTHVIRNHHISTKQPKQNLNIHNNRQRQQHPTPLNKEALHSHIKDSSLNRNIGKVRITSVFNKLINQT